MNKPLALSAGVGILSLLGGLYYSANMVKMDAQQAQPDMSAAYKAQDELNITNLSTARSQYVVEKGKEPDSLEDLAPSSSTESRTKPSANQTKASKFTTAAVAGC